MARERGGRVGLIAGLALAAACLALRAQVLPFEIIGLNEGLPQSQVAATAQDAEGYIWVATWGGLARYNGDAFTYYTTGNGLLSNRVQELLPARSGALWVATAGGLCVWKDHALSAVKDPLVTAVRCRALAEDAAGRLWVGTDRGLVVHEAGTFRKVVLPAPNEPRILDLMADREGVLAVTSEGLFAEGAAGAFRAVDGPAAPAGSLRAAFRTAEGLWIGTQGHGLWRMSPGGWAKELAEFPDLDVYSLSTDHAGTLFVCTSSTGLFLKRAGQEGYERWTTATGLPSNVVNSVMEDREGNLWVGTDIGGLARLGTFAVSNHGLSQGLPSPCVFGIHPGPGPGTLWVGTLRGAALYRYAPRCEVLETIAAAQGLTNELVWKAVVARDGGLWLLTDTSLLWRRPGQKRLEEIGAEEAFVRGLTMDFVLEKTGRLWVSGEDSRGGLCMRDQAGRWRRWSRTSEGREITVCRNMAERRAGGVWIAAEGAVLECDGESLRELPGLPAFGPVTRLTAVYEDPRGRLWVGGDGGLAVREPDGRWRTVNGGGALAEHEIYSLGEDSDGLLWIGTSRGAYRLRDDGTLRPFTPQDGLAGFECNQGGFFSDDSGAVWIGTVAGLTRFDPAKDRPNSAPPKIVVESAEFGGGSVSFPAAVRLARIHRSVVFRVALLAYRGHKQSAYRARMEGLESDWLPLRREPDLRYTNLPPGDHALLLQAVNESGVWGDVVRLPVHVESPLWMTWWFRVLMVLCLAGAVLAAHRWRTHLLKRRNIELEGVIAERTRELAKANLELHHLATHETLTGLPNRRAILQRLREVLNPEKGGHRRFGVLILDLDHFKSVNDTLGHAAGDQVLSVMSEKIRKVLRDGDALGRYGGDEFLVVLPGADLEAVESVARRAGEISETFSSGRRSVTVTVSCGGVAVPSASGREEAEILSAADGLLYEVKRAGRKGFRVAEMPPSDRP